MTHLGTKLRKAREIAGHTTRSLAEVSGVSGPLISQIETGHVLNPGILTVGRIAKALDLDLDPIVRAAIKEARSA